MRLEAAIINEQGVDFAVVAVKRSLLDQPARRDEAIVEFSAVFDHLPTVLMGQDSNGTPRYYGRDDLVRFVANVPFEALPWAEYSVN